MSFDIDLTCKIGERIIRAEFRSDQGIVSLFGASGAGKTSILNMIAGLLKPDIGYVRIEGRTLFDSHVGIDIAVPARRSGYIFQDGRLFPHMTVRANLTYALKTVRRNDAGFGLDDAVELLGLTSLLDRRPITLSGGEAQRVAIGRALLSDPAFFLMDEPFSSLDMARRAEILDRVRLLHARTGIPILYVSHDPWELEQLGGTIVPIG